MMKKKEKKQTKPKAPPPKITAKKLPRYEPPQVTTYTDAEILEEMGPAQAVTGIIDP